MADPPFLPTTTAGQCPTCATDPSDDTPDHPLEMTMCQCCEKQLHELKSKVTGLEADLLRSKKETEVAKAQVKLLLSNIKRYQPDATVMQKNFERGPASCAAQSTDDTHSRNEEETESCMNEEDKNAVTTNPVKVTLHSTSPPSKRPRVSVECDSCKIVNFSSDASSENVPIRSQTCGHSICRSCVVRRHIAKCETTGRSQIVWLNCPICNDSKRAFNVLHPILDVTLCNVISSNEPIEELVASPAPNQNVRPAFQNEDIRRISVLTPSYDISRRDRAMQVEANDWVFFEGSNEEESEIVWLGRAVVNTTHDFFQHSCKWVNHGRSRTFCGVLIGRNEVAVNIRWYERTCFYPDGRCDYQVASAAPSIQNHAYFLFGGFCMTQVKGPPEIWTQTRQHAQLAMVNEVISSPAEEEVMIEKSRVWRLSDPAIMRKALSMVQFH